MLWFIAGLKKKGSVEMRRSFFRSRGAMSLVSLCLSRLAPMAALYQWMLPLCSTVAAITVPLPLLIYFIVTVGVARNSSLAKAAVMMISSDPSVTMAHSTGTRPYRLHLIGATVTTVIAVLALVAVGAGGAAMNTASMLADSGVTAGGYGMDQSAAASAAIGVAGVNKLENLPQMVAGVMDDDATVQTEHITQFRMY